MELIENTTESLIQNISDDKLLRLLYTFISGKSHNTGFTYRIGIQQFIDFLGGDHHRILEVEPFTIIQYKNHLLKDHSVSTTSSRISAISSMYRFLVKNEMIDNNPVLLIDRGDLKVNPYERSKTLSIDQFNQILRCIPDSPSGIRDRIIFQMIYVSGLRRSVILNLTGKDIHKINEKVFYRVKLKGGSFTTKELPSPIWYQIKSYLESENRSLKDDQCIFLPTKDCGEYLLGYHNRKRRSKGLSPEVLNQNLKRYGKYAGVEDISIHSLRHLGASMYYQLSNDILETMNFLNHKNINTTQVYLQSLTGEEHNHWQGMINHLDY
jgi:site-specific recombinase XerD